MLSCLCKHNRVRFRLKLQASAWFMESASFVVREQRDIDFSEPIKLLFISTYSTKVVFMSDKPLTAFVAVSLCQHLCLPLSLVRRLHTQQPLQSFLIISLSSTQLFMCPCLWACIHVPGGASICAFQSVPQSLHAHMFGCLPLTLLAVLTVASTTVVSAAVN